MIFPKTIQNFDERIFKLINQTWDNDFFDTVLPPIRDKFFFIPLYFLIAVAIIFFFKKKGIIYILLIGFTFAVTDQLSSAVVKPAVNRERPCNDAHFKSEVLLRVDGCGGGKSFTSSHATNTFGFAVILILLFAKKSKWIAPFALLWATAVSYAQVYVGVHYPLDILGGALLGTLVAYSVYYCAKKIFPSIFNYI